MPVNNQLMQALTSILVEQRLTLSEYDLIGTLQQAPYSLLAADALRDSLTMFRCHFVLFHHLYLLHDDCIRQGVGSLEIHTTRISLSLINVEQSDSVPVCSDPIRTYYLDWSNFEQTGQQEVDGLLDSFWQSMRCHSPVSEQEKHKALALFSLPESFDLIQLKSQYRNLQHQYHPDKGGSKERSQALQQAYKVLQKSLNSSVGKL